MLAKIGFGDYDRGCRAGMIRDRLRQLDKATEADMLAIQLDDRAVFLERWRKLFLDVLSPEAIARDARRAELKALLENWSGRASIDSAAYRFVWEIRLRIVRAVLSPLTARCRAADPGFRLAALECEAPTWALVTGRPAHLLDPAYADWDSLLLAMIDATLAEASAQGGPLRERTWGKKNVTNIQHPMSMASPLVGPMARPEHGRRAVARRQQGHAQDPGARPTAPRSGWSSRPAAKPKATSTCPAARAAIPCRPITVTGTRPGRTASRRPSCPGPAVNRLCSCPETFDEPHSHHAGRIRPRS